MQMQGLSCKRDNEAWKSASASLIVQAKSRVLEKSNASASCIMQAKSRVLEKSIANANASASASASCIMQARL
jgi:hypothetical protein